MSADTLLIVVVLLLVLALVGLAVLLFRPRLPMTDTAALEAVDRSGRELRDEIGRVRRDLGEVGSAQRTELSGSLNNFSQTLATQMSGIATVQDGKIDGFAAQLAKLTEANEARLTEIRNTLETKLRELQGENAAKLEEMRKTVDERLHATLEHRLGESFKLVSDRLEQVHRGLGEMQTLAAGVGDLKRVLTNVKTRGTWGEVQLEALLELVLVREQFEKNVATRPGSSERVEFAIRMPGRVDGTQVWLPIDSKFPAEDYDRLIAAQDRADAAGVEESARALEAPAERAHLALVSVCLQTETNGAGRED